MSFRVQVTAEARRQLLEIDEWWTANRPEAPDLIQREFRRALAPARDDAHRGEGLRRFSDRARCDVTANAEAVAYALRVGGIGVRLELEPGGHASLDDLTLSIWDVVLAFMRRFGHARDIVESYAADLKHEGHFHAGEKDIVFMFPDYAGLCSLSMYATHHWTRLALARQYEEVTAVVAAHGQRLLGPRLDLAVEIAGGSSGGVLVLANKKLWLATRGSNGLTLMGNDETSQLTAARKKYVEAAVRLNWCGCSPCGLLRRELRIRQGWTSALVAQWVCRQLGVSFEHMGGNARGKELAQARAAAAFLIVEGGARLGLLSDAARRKSNQRTADPRNGGRGRARPRASRRPDRSVRISQRQ